ncbi:hypothetical protein COCON_G00199970 [Conger conger]|uniref:THD domain-containing protein n=1 Tax=Conger conger TaxID=82655 RepID=A0A9Q1D2R5_CONCO|nr:tumor necrosis factor ligand superfamily member 13B-like [Conger conger]KAJ8256133.1 hypothetical protein COCON_G00199970 [Conger conger]
MASAVPGSAHGAQQLSRAVLALTVFTITSSSLCALALLHTMALQAEVAALRGEVLRRREEDRRGPAPQLSRDGGEGLRLSGEMGSGLGKVPAHPQHGTLAVRKRRADPAEVATVLHPCLHMMPDSKRSLIEKDSQTAIPWQAGLRRGSALEQDNDTILVNEEGFYFVYGQVYYMDKTFAMGHVITRRKQTVVGDELRTVTLFRCIQSMDAQYPFNTCYTAGVVKLEAGDRLELLIPRKTPKILLDGDSTFFGAVRLA